MWPQWLSGTTWQKGMLPKHMFVPPCEDMTFSLSSGIALGAASATERCGQSWRRAGFDSGLGLTGTATRARCLSITAFHTALDHGEPADRCPPECTRLGGALRLGPSPCTVQSDNLRPHPPLAQRRTSAAWGTSLLRARARAMGCGQVRDRDSTPAADPRSHPPFPPHPPKAGAGPHNGLHQVIKGSCS